MPTQGVLATKVANAFIEDAASPLEVGSVGRSIRRYRRKHGGLWVGGRVTLTSAELGFSPNAVNRLAHYGDTSFKIPLSAITHIEVEPGFFTKIIAVTWTGGGVRRFRCYGAAKFAEQLRATVS